MNWQLLFLSLAALALCGLAALAATIVSPTTVLLVVGLGLGSLVLTVLPWAFIPATLFAVILLAQIGSVGPIDSTGRVGALLAVSLVFHAAATRKAIRVPLSVILATGIFAASIILSALVTHVRSPGWPGGGLPPEVGDLFFNLQLQLLNIAAGVTIGLIAGADERGRFRVFRGLAWLTVLASAGSALYWAWSSGFVADMGPLGQLFDGARGGLYSNRSGFPFDQDPNTQAVLFAVLAGFVSPTLLASGRAADHRLAVLVLVSAAVGVLSTQSRTGIILLGIVALGLWIGSTQIRRPRLTTIAALVAVAALVILISNALPESRAFGETNTFSTRVAIWVSLLEDFADSPVIGQGFRYGAADFYGASAHNEYVLRFVDGGIIGGLSFLFALAVFVRIGWSLTRDGMSRAAGIGMLTALAVLGLGMMTLSSWTTGGPTALLSWMLFGLAGAMVAARETEQPIPIR